MNAGVLSRSPYSGVEELLRALGNREDEAVLAMDRISLFAAMEIAAMQVLMEDYGSRGKVFLAGSMGEEEFVVDRIGRHLGVKPDVLGKWSASIGCAEIARDIAGGADRILGLDVHFSF